MNLDWSSAPLFGRTEPMQFALDRLHCSFPDKVQIVEVGTAYRYDIKELGNAILAFAWYASQTDSKVSVFDPLISSVVSAQDILKVHGKPPRASERVRYFRESGLKVGELIKDPIHFIYLDAFIGKTNHNVCNEPNSDKNEWYQVLYSKAKHLFVKGSLILIDDTNQTTYEGKGATLVPHLLSSGEWIRVDGFPTNYAMVLLEKVK